MRNSLNKLLVMKLFFASCLGFLLLSCTDAKKKDAEVDKNPTVITRYDKSLVIAYYHQDSLKERFDYYKKEDQVITRKQKMFEAEMKRRGKELEDYVRRNDEKARNGLLSQNEIMQIQQKAQTMEQELMQYQQAQAAKIEEESVKKLEAITKKIETLGKMYSEKNNIDILLIHGAGGQLNFINEKMNVTSDFIRFLNENQANIEKDLKRSGKTQKGHLYELEEVFAELTLLHRTLLEIMIDEKYKVLVENALPSIEEFASKSTLVNAHPIEVCLHAMNMKLQLKLRKQEITAETDAAMDSMRILLAYIGREYAKMKTGQWGINLN